MPKQLYLSNRINEGMEKERKRWLTDRVGYFLGPFGG